MAEQPDDSGGKPWERPWSTDEMRRNADNWSLAADSGLLKRLQQVSQDVLSHTHSTEKALDSLLETINTTNTNINNVTNDFLCLANTQFLESRVYDDEVDSPQEAPVADAQQEAGDVDMITKVKSALSIGINLLDTMFDPMDQNSGVENDFLAGVRNRSPKNPYSSRPLPHLIGSAAFMADDNVGLVSSEKNTEQTSAKVPAMDDVSMYSDESILTSSAKRNNMDDDSSNTSFCLGDDTPVQHKKPSRDAVSITGPDNDVVPVPGEKSFADELAGKLASMVSPESKVPPPLPTEPGYEKPVLQDRPSKKRGDMFGIPPSDDEDDALFSGRSGLFSGGRGLFDDVDDADNPREIFKDKAVVSSTPQQPPVSKPKVNSNLFDSNSADEDNDDLFAVPAKKEPARPPKQLDAPRKPLSIGDVISQAAKRNPIASVPVSGKGNTSENPAEKSSSVSNEVPPPITTAKKVPAGGRSMFGAAGIPIPKEALRRRPSSSSESCDDAGQNEKITPNSGGGLFSPNSPDEDDLFQTPAPSVATPSAPSPKPSVKQTAPRSPDEDDLFAVPENSDNVFKGAESKRKSAPKTNKSLGLFDAEGSSDEDNLFNPRPLAKQSLFSTIPPPLTKSDDKPKKVSLFDDSDSGDDEFLFSSASSAGSRRSQASVDIFNSSSAPVLTEKKPLRKGLFDDDSLFSSQVDGPDVDIFHGVGNDSSLSATNTTAPTNVASTTSASPAVTTTKTVNPVLASSTTAPASSATSKNSTHPVIGAKPVSSVASTTTATSSASPAVPASTKTVTASTTTATTASSATPVAAPKPKTVSSVASTTAPTHSASPAVPASTKTVSASTTTATTASSATSAVATSSKTVSSVPTSAAPASSAVSSSSIKAIAVPPSSAPSSVVASSLTKSSPTISTGPFSSPIGGSLFDDDEDLFSVAKPPPLQKPSSGKIPPPINKFIAATTEDLFSGLDSQTKDLSLNTDDLFSDLPGDDLFSNNKIPSTITSMFDSNPKVPVDDLFGTDEGDGDISVPKKPTLTISDAIVETLKSVPIVDTPKHVAVDEKKEPKPETKPTPPRTLDIRNTTNPNVVGSFDDDDEDLFKTISKPVPAEKHTEKDIQHERVQVLEPQVDQPKSVPVPPTKPPKPVPTARKPSVSTPEDEGAKTELPRPTEVLPKPAARTSVSTDEDKPQAVQPPPIKARTPLAGLGLNINPLALLPGAQPPNKKTPAEEPVGFDQPMENSSTLHSAQKERVRGSKRRPPSRRARQEASKVVDHTGVEITSPSSVLSPSTDEDDLFGVPQDLPPDSGPWPFNGAPILSPADPKLVAENVDVDSKTVDDPLLKMRAETSSGTDTDADASEDHSSLFAFVKKKPKEPQPESLFSQTPTLPTKNDVQKMRNSLTDDDVEDEDLFKPSAAVKKMADLGSGAKTWKLSDDDDDDDLFTTGVGSSKSGIVNSTKEPPKEARSEEKKPTSKSEPSAVNKNESSKGLFSQPPPRKTESTLFDDDDDLDDEDLFSSSSKPPPLPVSKALKKVTNSPQWKDEDLFDDPLSGR